jgi:hypothetical protein
VRVIARWWRGRTAVLRLGAKAGHKTNGKGKKADFYKGGDFHIST